MAYKIEYTDFDDKLTTISIYKGVESNIIVDYQNRVEQDSISSITSTIIETDVLASGTTGAPPDYGGMELCSITTTPPRTFHFKQQRISFSYLGYTQGNGVYGEGLEPSVTNCPTNLYYKSQCNSEEIPITDPVSYEGEGCLRNRIDILNGENRTFCGGNTPLKFEWYASNKYTRILGSGVDIEMVIKDIDDKAALTKILDGGYYITIIKDNEVFWNGRLTSRYYTEPYITYPYVVKLTGSDQLANLDKFQPIMIDFNTPDKMEKILFMFGRALVGDHMYPNNFTGAKIDTLWFGNRLISSDDNVGYLLLERVFSDPLNWISTDDNQYESYKTILDDILQSLNAKLFQWKSQWYIIGMDAQHNGGDVTLREYTFTNLGLTATVKGNTFFPGEFFNPYICSIDDGARSVFDNAEISYEPPYRRLQINQVFNKSECEIDGFCNARGDFFSGHDGKSLEFDLDTRDLRHWEGDVSFISPYGDNSGWARIGRVVNTELTAYKDTIIEKGEYDSFSFSVDGLAIQGSNILEVYFSVGLIQNGVTKWLEYDDEWKWSDTYRTFEIQFTNRSQNVSIDIEYAFDNNDNELYDTQMRVEIKSIAFPHGAQGAVIIKGLKADVEYSEWVSTDYENILYKDINIPNSDATIIDITSNWGIVIDDLSNKNHLHRSAPYDYDGTPLLVWEKSGYTSTKTLMDWLGDDLYNDNLYYTPTLRASYKSFDLTPLSFIIDYEERIYRFVSGTYLDKTGIWNTIHTEAKWLTPLGDFSSLDFNDDFFATN